MMKLSAINIYPIKSLTGLSLNQSSVELQGLKSDRLMMLVDQNGMFITQRKYHQMALVKTEVIGNTLLINAPNLETLKITDQDFSGKNIDIKIWNDECTAELANEFISEWFSQYLKTPVMLVKYVSSKPRKSDPAFSNESDIVSFADGFPLLAISEASLDNLNQKLAVPVTMKHFRPNLVIQDAKAYAEDYWKVIKIGDVIFDAVKLCSRCILTTVDPITGIKNTEREPLKTLTSYRKMDAGVMFGMNLIPRNKGLISTQDEVIIIETSS